MSDETKRQKTFQMEMPVQPLDRKQVIFLATAALLNNSDDLNALETLYHAREWMRKNPGQGVWEADTVGMARVNRTMKAMAALYDKVSEEVE